MNENNGPLVRTIPTQQFKVCTGCKFLDKQAMLRGHANVTDNYTCRHPDFFNEHFFGTRGRTIHYNHSGECTTPNWCPFVKSIQS